MRKNVAGQVVCAQINSKTDGTAVTTGTTTVYVLGDGGTQATGGGTVTHKGQGCWSYQPTQAETNYAHVAFTFVNSAGVSQTVQAYPVAYDPGDSAGLGLSRLDTNIASRLAAASYSPPLDAAGTRTAVGMAAANLDTQLAAISAKTVNLPAAPSGQVAIKKNTALPGLVFTMVDSADHLTPKPGLTIAAQRKLDGGAYASCTNSATDIGGGSYQLDLSATDLNGDLVVLKFSAGGADDRIVVFRTQA